MRDQIRIANFGCCLWKGAVLIPASEAVGMHGTVTGIDISKGMIKRLEKDLEQRGTSNAKINLMDAEDLRFQNATFDYVFCGFALFFFPNLRSALKEFF